MAGAVQGHPGLTPAPTRGGTFILPPISRAPERPGQEADWETAPNAVFPPDGPVDRFSARKAAAVAGDWPRSGSLRTSGGNDHEDCFSLALNILRRRPNTRSRGGSKTGHEGCLPWMVWEDGFQRGSRQRLPGRQPPARAAEPGGRGCPQAHTPASLAHQQRRGRALHPHRPGQGPLPRGADTRRPRSPGHRPLLPKAKRRPALPRTAALGKAPSALPAVRATPPAAEGEAEAGSAPHRGPGQSP